jgi:Rieske Fe-S protein
VLADHDMTDSQTTAAPLGRRNFLVRAITAIHAAMAATVAVIVGGATLAPSFSRRDETWLRAAELEQLPENQPVPVTLRVMRSDGYSQVIDRTVVYLVRTGNDSVRALQSTCTHLGCRTSYDRKSKRILCPCHGGVFDVHGNVMDGPPPAPLPSLATKVEGGHVLVQV